MHKIVRLGRKKTLSAGSTFLKGCKKLLQLAFRHRVEEGLEENNGLPQTRIQIVVRGIEDIPIAAGVQGVTCEDFLRGGQKVGGELLDEFGKGGHFVEELGPSGKKHPTENTVETRDTLAAGTLKILGIQRSKIRRCAEMPCVKQHGVEQAIQGSGKPLAEGRRNAQNLLGFVDAARTPQAKRFIQIDTEHGIRCFKPVKDLQIGMGFIADKWGSPILRHRSAAQCGRAGPHREPPWSESLSVPKR
jgi:hypothetical protein